MKDWRDTDADLAWLNTAASGQVPPPVETKEQSLPFEKLRWEDFEKLCYRLAGLESNLEACRQYGVPGDEQHGIDIFARGADFQKYRVYQCKNEKEFGPKKIKDAVDAFREGEWYDKSDTFVLCTLWDGPTLAVKLKSLPELVDDFFGRAWVRVFCGDEIAQSLDDRLDAQALADLRRRLFSLYEAAFSIHDPGIPIPKSIPLLQRCVIPDVRRR